jgi:mono/diheme cytochrome c family protein
MTTRRRRVLAATAIVAAGLTAAACGSEGISTESNDSANVQRGAVLFADRCSGCHTLDVAGAQGGATEVHDRERADGPNFNVRRETSDSVLYAIRNGGFSGAIMPENIVVGQDAADVAAFLSKYAGGSRQGNDITPQSQPGGQDTTGGGQQTTTTQQSTTSTPEANTNTTTTGGGGTQQAAAQGKQLFTQNCAGCHTLSDAKATGNVGPNLDDLKPDQATTQRQVTNGGGGMPAFKGQLSGPEIQAVSQYVSSVAGS